MNSSSQAYAQAGIRNAREQIDIAEIHDCCTSTELVLDELLGFSPEGHAKDDVDAGFFKLNGGLPANSDGGLKCFGPPSGRQRPQDDLRGLQTTPGQGSTAGPTTEAPQTWYITDLRRPTSGGSASSSGQGIGLSLTKFNCF